MTLSEASIFARIPQPPGRDNPVRYHDPHGCFQLCLSQKTLDAIAFEITDGKGRPLSKHYHNEQPLPFDMVLRWEVLVPDT